MEKKITGRHVTAYTRKALSFSLFLSIKKCPAQKETNIDVMDMKSEDKPTKSFLGKSLRKSFCSYLEVRMARNENKAVMEKHKATSEETANTVSSGWFSRFGIPLFSLMFPGIEVDAAKATVAMSAATTEQDSEVLFSHSPPFLTNSSWVLLKISSGLLPSLLI